MGIPVSIALLWLEERTGIRGSIMWTLGAPVGFYFLGQALMGDGIISPASGKQPSAWGSS